MKTLPIAGSLALFASLVLLGCAAPDESDPAGFHRYPALRPPRPPPPAPQVMIAPHSDAPPQPVTLGEMTEAQRRELLLSSSSPIQPYTPAPLPTPPHDVHHEYTRSSGVPCNDSYYDSCRHGSDGCDFLTGLARVGVYTAAGAIIGHQFHEKGQGAAIGAGLALVSWPWFWGGGCSRW
jgi:hypothetical protein